MYIKKLGNMSNIDFLCEIADNAERAVNRGAASNINTSFITVMDKNLPVLTNRDLANGSFEETKSGEFLIKV